jgi:hypothetical protein
MEDVMTRRVRRYKKVHTETVKTDDLERKLEIEQNYRMEYQKGSPGKMGRWLHVLNDPKTGEALEKRIATRGSFQTVWRKADEDEDDTE